MRIERHRMLDHLEALFRFDDPDGEPPRDPGLDAALLATLRRLSEREARGVDDELIAGYVDDRLAEEERREAEGLLAAHPHLIEELLILDDVAAALGEGGAAEPMPLPIPPVAANTAPPPGASRAGWSRAVGALAATLSLGLGPMLQAPLATPGLVAMRSVEDGTSRVRSGGGVFRVGGEVELVVDAADASWAMPLLVVEGRDGAAVLPLTEAVPLAGLRGEDGRATLTAVVPGEPSDRAALVLVTSRRSLHRLERWVERGWERERFADLPSALAGLREGLAQDHPGAVLGEPGLVALGLAD